jgi:transmembrane sensor
MQQPQSFAVLFKKYVDGSATPAERQAFFKLVEQPEYLPELENLVQSEMGKSSVNDGLTTVEKEEILAHIFASTQATPAKRTLWPRIAVAASLLLFLTAGSYYLWKDKSTNQTIAHQPAQVIAPGGNKAILTLANGQQINLTGTKDGKLAQQNGTAVNKTAEGQIVYNSLSGEATAANNIAYNTLTTPRGGQYHLTLADGTNVWLNAASSITYPVAFTGKTRSVKITGEAYFEVAHNAAKPFRVTSGNQTTEVLGTHFDINAYDNEPGIKTTLLEGSVRVAAGNSKAVLKAGQQSALEGERLSVADVDADEAVAWKNGYFEFSEADIQTVMRQISRWYDVDVDFQGSITKETFTARIARSKNINQVLNIVKLSNAVKIEIQGRRVIVKE